MTIFIEKRFAKVVIIFYLCKPYGEYYMKCGGWCTK